MKKSLLILLTIPFIMTACNETKPSSSEINEKDTYQTKAVNIYRTNDKIDKTIDLRFYDKTPHVPYISVSQFYKEFFKASDIELTKQGSVYTYRRGNNAFLKFDTQEDEIGIYNIDAFSDHPDSVESNNQYFLYDWEVSSTTIMEKVVSLRNYHISLYGDEEAYVPLTLLTSTNGGLAGYNIAYNEKDIFVLDSHGYLTGETRNYAYFGDLYIAPLADLTKPRDEDLAIYSYYQLCYNFDTYRGYTSNLVFGDNNLVTLGLNGLLERYYPELKEMLLSTDRATYYAGFRAVFDGLFDGGHTMAEISSAEFIRNATSLVPLTPEITEVGKTATLITLQKLLYQAGYKSLKNAAFPEAYDGSDNSNYYIFDTSSETAYIGFDSFVTDFEGWNKYYEEGKKPEDIPLATDSYAFIRSALYQALEDNAKNVVLDLSTNGGGNSAALCGIYGLFNNAEGSFESNNTVDKTRMSEKFKLDVNLDGVCNELDTIETDKFKQFKVAVLTSEYSFSCGNLLPSMMKEIGFKIVGKKSGGGSCAISYETTAEGLTYYRSSHHCLSNLSGENIDNGVDLDYEIEVTKELMSPDIELYQLTSTKFYDFVTIANYLNSLSE